MERDDSGNLHVLEALLISLILLGAAYAVGSLQDSSLEQVRPRAELGRLVGDALVVLDGLDDGNGTGLLELYIAQQFHCTLDDEPAATDCDIRRSRNLSVRLESYLPLGAGYAVGVGNGAAVRELYRSPLPMGEAVSTSRTFAPDWNLTFATPEFSCYDATTDINLTMVPIRHGAVSWARHANATIGGIEHEGERAATPGWWNVTLPAASRPASGAAVMNVTGNASFPGSTAYESCDTQGLAPALRTALRGITFRASASKVPLGESISFQADLSTLETVVGITIDKTNVTLYEPLPPRESAPDSWIQAAHVSLTGVGTRTGTWEPEGHTLYGAHPALLRVGVTIGSEKVELRKLVIVDVALTTGEVPIAPPYRAVLQAWLPDWG